MEADPYLQFKPSMIAASALATARHCLACECEGECAGGAADGRLVSRCSLAAWPPALAHCSGYSLAQLEPCLRELARTHAHAQHQPYRAIPDKYKSNK